MTTTDGMVGGGYYDDHSEYQRKVADAGAALIIAAVDGATMPGETATFVIADYGSSTGANSMASMRTAVDAVRGRRSSQPIAVIHNDLPTNDWNQLFTNVRTSPSTYLAIDGPPVLPMAAAGSFFEPAAPAGSVNVGLSFSAAHWLREQPNVEVPGFYFSEAMGAARDELARLADADWTTFLSSRAADLAPGGTLLVQCVGTTADGDVTARELLQAMAAVGDELASDGVLSGDRVRSYLLPVYARTVDEAVAPVRDGGALAGAFDVLDARTDPIANPYLDTWRHDGDADAYGRSYAAFVRGFTESSLRQHLFADVADADAVVDAVVDDYFTRLTARFAADPERDAFRDWTLTVLLRRH